jgi:hypothetical protein
MSTGHQELSGDSLEMITGLGIVIVIDAPGFGSAT